LIDCHASSSRSFSVPGSSVEAISASKLMPAFVGLSNFTLPIGLSCSCCHNSGSGLSNLTPSGSMMSPTRSTDRSRRDAADDALVLVDRFDFEDRNRRDCSSLPPSNDQHFVSGAASTSFGATPNAIASATIPSIRVADLCLVQLAVSGRISRHHGIRRAHRQHRMIAVPTLPSSNAASVSRKAGLIDWKPCPNSTNSSLDAFFAEAGLQQPRLQVLHAPSVERAFLPVMRQSKS
jgi:hypothetical protein